jgi:hypothetical protein
MRRLRKTSILNEREVGLLAARLRKLLGESVMHAADTYGVDVELMLRFGSVASRCQEAREDRGLSLKDAAAKLKVPQYRLKAIEASHIGAVDEVVLKSYVELLGLERWFGQWTRHNRALHAKIFRNAD